MSKFILSELFNKYEDLDVMSNELVKYFRADFHKLGVNVSKGLFYKVNEDLVCCSWDLTHHSANFFRDFSYQNYILLEKVIECIINEGVNLGVYNEENELYISNTINLTMNSSKNLIDSVIVLPPTNKKKRNHNIIVSHRLASTKNNSFIKTFIKVPTKSKSFDINFYALDNKIYLKIESLNKEKDVEENYVFDLSDINCFQNIENTIKKRIKHLYYYLHYCSDLKKLYKNTVIDIENVDLKSLKTLIQIVKY